LSKLEALLPADDGEGREREALTAASRDVLGRSDAEFQTYALVGALARIVAAQAEEIDVLKRSKASSGSVSALKKEIKK
jgi:hypothetical protein